MDIDILVDVINDNAEKRDDETELEQARNQILGIAQPKIQVTTVDNLDLPGGKKIEEKAMDVYRKAIRERREVEFKKRLNAKSFREGIKDGVGKVKIDNTLSNKPNKKR